MKKLLTIVFMLALTVSVFAQDGALEIETGVDVLIPTGSYNQDGEFTEVPSGYSPMAIIIPITVLYEVFTGLQVGVKAEYDYYNEDFLDASGLNQPAIEVKYTSEFGAGAFVDAYMPFGSEDIVGTDPMVYFDIGVFYDGAFDFLLLYGEVVYTLTFEDEFENKQDSLSIQLKPGYQIMDALKVTLAAQVDYNFDRVIGGSTQDDSDGYIFWLAPGAAYQVMDMLELSLEVPFTLFGKRAFGMWGVSFRAKFNLL
ncbi:MAG: hypothetical protein JW822_07590 [Spirochaetales bacterium]|nr:hypothetical protein [Spirochaetales bacterium]